MDIQHKAGGMNPASAGTRDDFDRDLAHKLGNLLQVVNGNLELLASRIEDEQLRGYLANAQAAAAGMTELAHALIDPVGTDER